MGARREDSREEEAEEEKNLQRACRRGGKPARSRSSGAGGPRLQLPAFTSGDRVWTSAAQFLLSRSFMCLKSAACNKKKEFRGGKVRQMEENGGAL